MTTKRDFDIVRKRLRTWAYYAMKREIAGLGSGNFRGVCPLPAASADNRAAEMTLRCVYHLCGMSRRKPVCFSDRV